MRHKNRSLRVLLSAVAVLGLAACAKGNLDDNGSADSLLEVTQATIPPVSASLQDPDGAGPAVPVCIFTVTNAQYTLANKPKSALAISTPQNDIVVTGATITYTFENGTSPTAPSNFALGITVPANGTGQIQFPPATGETLTGHDGEAVSLSIRFQAHSNGGRDASITAGGVLFVNSCN